MSGAQLVLQARDDRAGQLTSRARRGGVIGDHAGDRHHVVGVRRAARAACPRPRRSPIASERLRERIAILVEADEARFARAHVLVVVDEAVEHGDQNADRQVGSPRSRSPASRVVRGSAAAAIRACTASTEDARAARGELAPAEPCAFGLALGPGLQLRFTEDSARRECGSAPAHNERALRRAASSIAPHPGAQRRRLSRRSTAPRDSRHRLRRGGGSSPARPRGARASKRVGERFEQAVRISQRMAGWNARSARRDSRTAAQARRSPRRRACAALAARPSRASPRPLR